MGLLSTIGAASGRAFGLTRVGAAIRDAYFNRVTLLLPGNGTNGAQNNTFLDSSSNNFTITRNGNPTQGTFSPFSQTGWSNHFDGVNTNYLSLASSADFAVGTTFTFECWIYPTVSPPAAGQSIFGNTTTGQFQVGYNGSSAWGLGALGTAWRLTTSTMPTVNAWNHIVVARSGTGTNQTSLFLNGTRVANGTVTDAFTTSGAANIGMLSSLAFTGYISNLRLVKGADVYGTGNTSLTVPTAPITPITNTVLLSCQSNRFIDTNTEVTAKTITVNGTPSVQAFSPFAPTAAYSAATVGGSGYFDGTGDYLSVLASSDFTFTGNFTIECWFYPTAALSTGTSLWIMAIGAGDNFALNVGSTSSIVYLGSAGGNFTATGNTIQNAWNHLAVVRSGSTVTLYINGNPATVTGTTSATLGSSTTTFRLGGFAGGISGYITNWRVNNGQALYTSAFTPPTSPLTTTSQNSTSTNTKLLLNFTNAGITDATAKNDLETVGNAQISTTQSKFGGSSMYFDGTGDYLLLPHTVDQMLGTGAFTIEMWIYRNASGTYGLVGKGTGTTGWLVSLNSSNQVVFTYGSSTITSTGTISATTWTYIAVVREGTGTNQTKIYISGSNDGTGTVSTDFNQTNAMYVGADRTGGSNYNGYIDDLRITKGFARTIATPSSAFALQ